MKSTWHLVRGLKSTIRDHIPSDVKTRVQFIKAFLEEGAMPSEDVLAVRTRILSAKGGVAYNDLRYVETGFGRLKWGYSRAHRASIVANKRSFFEYQKTYIACIAITGTGVVDPRLSVAFHHEAALAPRTTVKDLKFLQRCGCLVVPIERYSDGSLFVQSLPVPGAHSITTGVHDYLVVPNTLSRPGSQSYLFVTKAASEAEMRAAVA